MNKADLFEAVNQHIGSAKHILVVQAENPDGDSLGSALALEAILSDLGKTVSLFCAVEMPKYLRYMQGWDRVQNDLPKNFDLTFIVDTGSSALLEKTLVPENLSQLTSHPLIVIDHHTTASDFRFKTIMINDANAVSTGELILKMALKFNWPLPVDACDNLAISILADSLGLASEGTTAESIHSLATLVEKGANLSNIDARRREFMKKPPEILAYKGQLLQRIEYFLDGSLALIHIPWNEIEEYSDQYNPSVLVLDEMRLVEKVRIAVALKTYPDGKVTGKIRTNPEAKIAEQVAGFFGGGGHPYAAGFKVYNEDIETIKNELISATDKALREYHDTAKS